MIFQNIFTRKSILIFFLLFAFSSSYINAESSNELQAVKRDVLPDFNVPVEGIEGAELVGDAESQLVRVEAEDPDLVGSVLDINIKEANKIQSGIRPSSPIMDIEESKALFLSIMMIIVSEIGDKTFFIAALMAMKNSRIIVFSAALCSLILMSVLSAVLGYAVPNLIPKEYTDFLAALLFLCFGLKMLYSGYYMSEEEAQQELNEVTQELKEKEEFDLIETAEAGGVDEEVNHSGFKDGLINLCQFIFSPVFVQTFVLTFLGEWGDRSQIATIALAAAQNVYFVTLGVILGHSICTGIAVIGGRFLAAKISVKSVTIIGGLLFLAFSVLYLHEAISV
ncbi:7744_t:CDS:2 [Funneliformis caledonium]|uniref:GDT1 family protein n=2 Tax=Funneliformis TaxID=1117308 RepID=A0A9N9CZD0_9GLOM|nr:7744_t:CDS:2 [Funneliformis caledonium]